MQALIGHESHHQPYAIGINGSNRLNTQPSTRDEAIIQAKTLRSQGIDLMRAWLRSMFVIGIG